MKLKRHFKMPRNTPTQSPPKLSHFLCIPVVTPASRQQLQQSLDAFRTSETTKSTSSSGTPSTSIPEKAVRPLGTLHLTLGVLSLLSQERIDSAVALLHSLDLQQLLASSHQHPGVAGKSQGGLESELGAAGDLKITLKGLTSMHDPSKTSVLYTSPVDSDLKLLNFCQRLKDVFTDADLLVRESRPLLLHATIVNTVYVRRGKSVSKLTIDAREVLERYKETEWVSVSNLFQ